MLKHILKIKKITITKINKTHSLFFSMFKNWSPPARMRGAVVTSNIGLTVLFMTWCLFICTHYRMGIYSVVITILLIILGIEIHLDPAMNSTMLPNAPEGWRVYEEGSNFYYITPKFDGQQYKITKACKLDPLIKKGLVNVEMKKCLVFCKKKIPKKRTMDESDGGKKHNFSVCYDYKLITHLFN